MKKIILFSLAFFVLLMFSFPSSADGTALRIETTQAYPGMSASYANGYVPTAIGGQARVVLPLAVSPGNTVDVDIVGPITVTPILPSDGPFIHVNYEFEVSLNNGVYLVDRAFPLNAKRINGTYEIMFLIQYKDDQGELYNQSFPVYVTITDGTDPDYEEPEPTPETTPVVGQLRIDSNTLYEGMGKTYGQGYVPTINNGVATIILPLKGVAYYGEVTLTADLGSGEDNPFVLGNYSQTLYGRGLYVFKLDIPLKADRINGAYPVTLYADYLDIDGEMAQQSFTVNVTITDGEDPPDPYATPEPEEVERPELFIRKCTATPDTVTGNEEFEVEVVIDNIGAIRARNVILSFGSEEEGIVPVGTAGAMLLDNIASEASSKASFKLKTTRDVLAGNRGFFVTLDYRDLYGGEYSTTRQFLIAVHQPVDITYDLIVFPKEVEIGETITIPSNVFNIGKSYLRNVTITLTGDGLFPKSSVFLGDVAPGQAGIGEMEVYVDMPVEGDAATSGLIYGNYVIRYQDELGETYTVDIEVESEIKNLEQDEEYSEAADYSEEEGYSEDGIGTEEELSAEEGFSEDEAGSPTVQWWVYALIGFAVIVLIFISIIIWRLTRMMKIGKKG